MIQQGDSTTSSQTLHKEKKIIRQPVRKWLSMMISWKGEPVQTVPNSESAITDHMRKGHYSLVLWSPTADDVKQKSTKHPPEVNGAYTRSVSTQQHQVQTSWLALDTFGTGQ